MRAANVPEEEKSQVNIITKFTPTDMFDRIREFVDLKYRDLVCPDPRQRRACLCHLKEGASSFIVVTFFMVYVSLLYLTSAS